MMTSQRTIQLALGYALAAAALVGCGAKPPECGAEETVATIREMLREGVQNTLAPEIAAEKAPHTKEYFGQILQAYLADMQISVTEIVSNGYDSGSKKFSCAGRLSVIAPMAKDNGFGVRSAYSTQSIEGEKGKFLVQVEEFQPLLKAVVSDGFRSFVAAKVTADKAANPAQFATFEQKDRAFDEARTGLPAEKAEYSMGINVLKFERRGSEALSFEYVSDAPAGTCTIKGTAQIMGSMARFQGGEQVADCAIQFQFSGDGRLDVIGSRQCINQCPPDQHALDGRYQKK